VHPPPPPAPGSKNMASESHWWLMMEAKRGAQPFRLQQTKMAALGHVPPPTPPLPPSSFNRKLRLCTASAQIPGDGCVGTHLGLHNPGERAPSCNAIWNRGRRHSAIHYVGMRQTWRILSCIISHSIGDPGSYPVVLLSGSESICCHIAMEESGGGDFGKLLLRCPNFIQPL